MMILQQKIEYEVRSHVSPQSPRVTHLVNRVKSTIKEKIQTLYENSGHGIRQCYVNLIEAEHILLSDLLTQDEEETITCAPDMHDTLVTSQKIFSSFESVLEKSFVSVFMNTDARNVLLNNADNITQNYLARYHTLVRNEIVLGKMQSSDNVLFIGSGPFPVTAIELARQKQCHVDCVECLEAPVVISSDVVKHLGLERYIKVFHGRGEFFDCEKYDLILIGVLAQPKLEIIKHINDTAKSGCRVLYRTTFGLRKFIYPPALPSQLAGFSYKNFFRAHGNQALSCMLLKMGNRHGN